MNDRPWCMNRPDAGRQSRHYRVRQRRPGNACHTGRLGYRLQIHGNAKDSI